ncbi:hypothetical protein CG91_gp055 [Mycobacterium phage 39HC]|uniref:hypothetical protein n=1 Tax=Mycobacterium phage 39HC TaxID=1463809 RepID=UPI0003F1DAFB|nr:hypothetical protein CG91_gp055 [Mycobacterium phage 39HC]AHJ88355.1 hypothetical protein 39HC_055 [Mycobacterium phage 39HC]AHJ88455.1 hypothetical protein 40BC_055 [Mycobacterium phage 40BC]
MTRPAPKVALQVEMDFWDGLGVPTEWFVNDEGTAALGVFGAHGDGAQIVSLDVNEDGTVAVSATDPVEFSTGGPEC